MLPSTSQSQRWSLRVKQGFDVALLMQYSAVQWHSKKAATFHFFHGHSDVIVEAKLEGTEGSNNDLPLATAA